MVTHQWSVSNQSKARHHREPTRQNRKRKAFPKKGKRYPAAAQQVNDETFRNKNSALYCTNVGLTRARSPVPIFALSLSIVSKGIKFQRGLKKIWGVPKQDQCKDE